MVAVAITFFKHLASHAANCRGGTVQEIQQKRVGIYADIRTEMSIRLASELAERLCAYAGGAKSLGRTISPASGLLQVPLRAVEEQ